MKDTKNLVIVKLLTYFIIDNSAVFVKYSSGMVSGQSFTLCVRDVERDETLHYRTRCREVPDASGLRLASEKQGKTRNLVVER